MKTIYKYPLHITSRQTLLLPPYAEILSVQFQGDELFLWAVVDTAKHEQEYVIRIFATGKPFDPASLFYLATVQCGELVWHVYREPGCACSPPCIPRHNCST